MKHTESVYNSPGVEEEEETRQHLQPSYRSTVGHAADVVHGGFAGWDLAKRGSGSNLM